MTLKKTIYLLFARTQWCRVCFNDHRVTLIWPFSSQMLSVKVDKTFLKQSIPVVHFAQIKCCCLSQFKACTTKSTLPDWIVMKSYEQKIKLQVINFAKLMLHFNCHWIYGNQNTTASYAYESHHECFQWWRNQEQTIVAESYQKCK